MRLQENIPLAPLTTFRVGGPARFFVRGEDERTVREAVEFTRQRSLPLLVLGGGSNLVVADAGFPGLVLHIAISGIQQREAEKQIIFHAGAGVEWDSFVEHAVKQNCGGVECLSGIPGTVGGTPVQNVGAYGQEVAETIASVRALDVETLQMKDLPNRDAGFAYRISVFNTSERGRYIVLQVSYALARDAAPHLEYADLKKFFAGKNRPTLAEARAAVREIRRSKAMLIVEGDPDCRSAGSFFKNPLVTPQEHERISALTAKKGEKVPSFAGSDGRLKLSAAWLVEHAGFHKGLARGAVGISTKHALAIVNRGGATAADIIALKNEIQQRVAAEFGIELHPEPVFVGFDAAP